MTITIEISEKEIAPLVLALQGERPEAIADLVKSLQERRSTGDEDKLEPQSWV